MIAKRVIYRNDALDDPEVPLPELPLVVVLGAATQTAEVTMFPWMRAEPFPTL
jgi:hypothetical protein